MFRSVNSPALRARGLQGDAVLVRLQGDLLLLAGSEGGAFSIPAASVDRLRHFRAGAVHQLPSTIPMTAEVKIWWDGQPRPILLVPARGMKGYGATLGGFAERVAALRGVDRLKLGPGPATAIVNLLIVVPPCLLLLAGLVLVSVMDGGLWWLATVLLSGLFLWLVGRNIASRWPRRAGSVAAFKADLP